MLIHCVAQEVVLGQRVCNTVRCASTDIHEIKRYNNFVIAMFKPASCGNKLCLRNTLVRMGFKSQ